MGSNRPPRYQTCQSECFSPVACNGFGYCRRLNSHDTVTTPELIRQRQNAEVIRRLKLMKPDQIA